MDEQGKNIKHLLCGLAATPNPFFLLTEFLLPKDSFIKDILNLEEKIGKINTDLFGKNKYDGIELVLWGMFDEDWNIREKRFNYFYKNKIPVHTFHACFETFPKKFKSIYLNLAENNSQTRRSLKAHLELVSRWNKDRTILVVHPGTVKNKNEKKQGIKNVINNLEFALNLAKKNNIIICIENMSWGWESNNVSFCSEYTDLKYILNCFKDPNLKIIFDWGHLNSCLLDKNFRNYYYQDSQDFSGFKHINHFIDELGVNIVHTHLHYNRSHQNLFTDFGEGAFKKMLIYLFFWTGVSKFVRRKRNKNFYDEHLTLNKIEAEYYEGYRKTIKNLINKTSIADYGYITHEYAPKKIFKFIPYSQKGATEDDFIKSLHILKKMIAE